MMNIRKELEESGIPHDAQRKLHYRPVTATEADQLTGFKLNGWVVELRDAKGNSYGPAFYRLKPEEPTASGAKYLTSKGAGCRPYFSPLVQPRVWQSSEPLYLTEGEKKADSLSHHGFPALGLSGVDAWKDKRSGESQPLPELDEINWNRRVYVVFDSDVVVKDSVRDALERLSLWLRSKGATPMIVLLPCELDGGKNGADDFLVRHGSDRFRDLVQLAKPATSKKRGKLQFTWLPELSGSHEIATMLLAILQRQFAIRPKVGIYEWTGKHWARSDESPKDLLTEKLHRWLNAMQWMEHRPAGTVNAIIGEVSSTLKRRHWDDPQLLAFANGTLHLRDNRFERAHHQKHRLTHAFPFPFEPNATCPKWLAFLTETFVGDTELIQLLRAAMKWSVLPKPDAAFEHELYFDVYGPRGSGKGTISEILKGLVGKAGFGIARPRTFSNTNALAGLIGKKVALDPDAAGHMTDAGVFNSVVSNEEVETKILFENIGSARLGVVVWRFYNDQPTVAGQGVEGMGRRNVVFRIERKPSRPDPKLKQKLLGEIEGIFQWVWSLPLEAMDEAFLNRGEIQSIREASVETHLNACPALRFLIECYPDGASRIAASALYQHYQRWCADSGLKPLSNTSFGREIKKVQGLVQGCRSRTGNVYTIGRSADFDWATHLGVRSQPASRAGLNPTQVQSLSTDHAQPELLHRNESEVSVQGVQGFTSKNTQKEKEENIAYIEKVSPSTLQTIHTLHSVDKVPKSVAVGSAWDNEDAGEDDPHWG